MVVVKKKFNLEAKVFLLTITSSCQVMALLSVVAKQIESFVALEFTTADHQVV